MINLFLSLKNQIATLFTDFTLIPKKTQKNEENWNPTRVKIY